MLSLKSAAEDAYGQIRGTDFASEIETIGQSPLEITRLVAQQLLSRGAVWGNVWPSQAPEQLRDAKWRGLSILDDIESLAYSKIKEPVVRNAIVKQSDVNEFVRYVKSISTTF